MKTYYNNSLSSKNDSSRKITIHDALTLIEKSVFFRLGKEENTGNITLILTIIGVMCAVLVSIVLVALLLKRRKSQNENKQRGNYLLRML